MRRPPHSVLTIAALVAGCVLGVYMRRGRAIGRWIAPRPSAQVQPRARISGLPAVRHLSRSPAPYELAARWARQGMFGS